MSSMIYRFRCPLCGTAIEAHESVEMHETHLPDRTLVHVRIHDGHRLIHECQARAKNRDLQLGPRMS
jgi:hypothetical protein